MSSFKEQSEGRKEVAVVGGGLVGSLHAILLSQRGFRVHLYESRKDLRKEKEEESRRRINLGLSHRGLAALKAAGLEEEILQRTIPTPARKIHAVDGKTYSMFYGRKEDCLFCISRRGLNELLLTKAEEIPDITLHFEHKLSQASLENKSLVFQVGTDQEEVTVKTDFIFGCDGAHSTVRRQMMRWGRLNYSQEYIDHGYKELSLPATENGDYAMEPNFAHIWPRQEFMIIALPNLDRTFTLALFMPLKMFDSIETEEDALAFFAKYFPDIVDKIGAERLFQQYLKNPVGKLISVKCSPHFMAGSTLILGDAAHAMVPFYAQGMNGGFEDCLIYYDLLVQTGNDLAAAAQKYQDLHWTDTQIICDLSMCHYLEMRSHVTSPVFLLWRKLDGFLSHLFPRHFIPLYTMVAFTRIPYHQVVHRHTRQRMLVRRGVWFLSVSSLALLGYLLFRYSGLEMSLKYRILPCVVKCVVSDYID